MNGRWRNLWMPSQENTQTKRDTTWHKRDTVNFTRCVFEGVWGFKKRGTPLREIPQYREPGSNRHRHKVRGILSPLRLPISPSRQQCKSDLKNKSLLRRRPDSNWWIAVLQTGALPLGYDAFNKKAPRMGPWAKERIWTVDPHVGNVMLYQLSYFRNIKKQAVIQSRILHGLRNLIQK